MTPHNETNTADKRAEQFDELKKLIRSIVIPNQNGIKIGTLLNDYKEIEGRELPYKELGYRSVHHMLQSMPDVVRFDHNKHADYVLFPVADESTQHIQRMVQEQKKAPGPVRRSNSSSGRSMAHSMMNRYRSAPQIQRPIVHQRFNNRAPSATQFVPQAPVRPVLFNNPPLFPYNQSFIPLSNTNNWAAPPVQLSMSIPNGTPIIGRKPGSMNYQSNSGVPQYAQENVTIMLSKFLCGLHLKNFPSFYMHDFKCAFNYQAYGFNNLDDCLRSLTNICVVAEDGMVYKKKEVSVTCIPNTTTFQLTPNLSKVVSTRPIITRTTTATRLHSQCNVTKATTTTSVTITTLQAVVTVTSTVTTVTTTVSSLVTKPRPSYTKLNSVSHSRENFDWSSWLNANNAESESKLENKAVMSNSTGGIKVTLSNKASSANAENSDWNSNGTQERNTPNGNHVHFNGIVATSAATSDSVDATAKGVPAKKIVSSLANLRKIVAVTATASMTATVTSVTTSIPKTTTTVTQSKIDSSTTALRRPKSMLITLENKQSGQGSQRIVTNCSNNCESLINRDTDGDKNTKIPSVSALKRFVSKNDVRSTEKEWPLPTASTSTAAAKLAPAGSQVSLKESPAAGDSRSKLKVEEWLRRNEDLKKGNEILIKKVEMDLKFPSVQPVVEIVDSIEKFPPQVISTFRRLIASHPNGIPATEFLDDYEKEVGFDMNPLDWGIATPIQVFYSLPSIFAITPPDINNQLQFDGAEGDHILYDANNIPEDVKHYLNSLASITSRQPRIPPGQTVPKGAPVEEKVKLRILKLLQMMTEGIVISDFGCIYQINFREDIYPEKWGFETFFELFCALSLELPISVRGGGEPKVCLVSPLFFEWLQKCITEHRFSALRMFVDFPTDAVLPGEALTKIEMPSEVIMDDNDEKQDYSWVTVLITSAINPNSFWVHIQGEEFNEALNQLMTDLEFYNKPESDRYRVPTEFINRGLVCAARFPGDQSWHRVRINRTHTADKVTVYYVDYGGLALIDRKDLRLLKREFFTLKEQAIHVCLKGIVPMSDGTKTPKWSINARQIILKFSNTNYWLACLFYAKNSSNKHEVVLCDTNDENDVYVHKVLLEKGIAELPQREKEKSKDLNCSAAPEITEQPANLSFSARIKQLAKKSMSARHLDSIKRELRDEAEIPKTLRDVMELEKKLQNTNFSEEGDSFNFYAQCNSTTTVSNLFPSHQSLTGKEVVLSLGTIKFFEKKIKVFSIDDNVYVLAAQIDDLLSEVNVWKHIRETSFELEILVLEDGRENILNIVKLDEYAKPGVTLYNMKGVMRNLINLRRIKEVEKFKTFFRLYSEQYANNPKRMHIVDSIERSGLAQS